MSLFNQIVFSQKQTVSVGGALWNVIATTTVAGGGTSGAINTTGANLIVIFNEGTGFVTVSDSQSNTYTAGNDPSGTPRAYFKYKISPTTNASHTFTISGTSSMIIVALALSTGTPVFDTQTAGASGTSGGFPNGGTVQAGSITPENVSDIMLSGIIFDTAAAFTGVTVNSSYVIANSVHSSEPANLRFAYKIKSDLTAENPTWTNGTGAGADYAITHMAFRAADITTGLLMRYALDDNAGNTTVLDSSGNNRHATASVNTSTLHTTAKIGTGAMLFDGSTQDINTNYIWSTSDASMTMAAWIKFTTTGDNWSVVSNYNGQLGILGLAFNNGARFNAFIEDTSTNVVGAQADSIGSLNDGTWHHIAYTYNQSTFTLQLYVDGVAQESNTNSSVTGLWTGGLSGQVYIAGNNNGASFPGAIDEVRIYNRALNAGDMLALFNFT
jgi:hypothetical protein